MWAQLIRMRTKPGQHMDAPAMLQELEAAEPPGSGLIRSTVMQDQSDPSQIYVLVVFESEALARAREQDPVREAALAPIRARMAEMFEGPPEFVDLTVLRELAP
jgi:quinol monooxygenase YgiN